MAAFKHGPADSDLAGLWEVVGKIVAETKAAILLDDGTVQHWLPRRYVKLEPRRDGLVDVAMPEWLARNKGFV